MTQPTIWHRCYEDSWKGLIVPQAFAHPAKFARGLIRRIYRHCLERGYLKPGDTVLDPFGGVALGAADAIVAGLNHIAVELEPHFVALGQRNIALWQKYQLRGKALILQGDSRRLREVVLTSWPGYVHYSHGSTNTEYKRDGSKEPLCNTEDVTAANCGTSALRGTDSAPTSEKIRNPGSEVHRSRQSDISHGTHLRETSVQEIEKDRLRELWSDNAALCSPSERRSLRQPAGESQNSLSLLPHERDKAQVVGGEKGGSANSQEQRTARLEPQISLIVSSPPYAETLKGDGSQAETAEESRAKRRTEGGSLGQSQRTQGYGSAGNLGNLPAGEVSAVVSSPPWEGSINDGADHKRMREKYPGWGLNPDGSNRMARSVGQDYGTNQGQLGNITGETFWTAAHQIVSECHALLKPGGVAVWVVKAFVRKKALVDFPGDWRRLCESVGFVLVEEIHASLVKERKDRGLFGGDVVKRTERKSFFRRLAEKKGSPRIDHEVVLILRKA